MTIIFCALVNVKLNESIDSQHCVCIKHLMSLSFVGERNGGGCWEPESLLCQWAGRARPTQMPWGQLSIKIQLNQRVQQLSPSRGMCIPHVLTGHGLIAVPLHSDWRQKAPVPAQPHAERPFVQQSICGVWNYQWECVRLCGSKHSLWPWSPEREGGSEMPPSLICVHLCPQICRHFQCVSASVLNYDCDVEKQCHGHGVSRERQQVLKWWLVTLFFCFVKL